MIAVTSTAVSRYTQRSKGQQEETMSTSASILMLISHRSIRTATSTINHRITISKMIISSNSSITRNNNSMRVFNNSSRARVV